MTTALAELPNLFSPYIIESVKNNPARLQELKLIIRGKDTFFQRKPRRVCQYDFRTRQMD